MKIAKYLNKSNQHYKLELLDLYLSKKDWNVWDDFLNFVKKESVVFCNNERKKEQHPDYSTIYFKLDKIVLRTELWYMKEGRWFWIVRTVDFLLAQIFIDNMSILLKKYFSNTPYMKDETITLE